MGHNWTPTHAPANYETMWWITAFDECTSCLTLRIKHVDAQGRFQPYHYRYPADWAKGYAGRDDLNERKLDYLTSLGPEMVVVNPKIKRKLPTRLRNGQR